MNEITTPYTLGSLFDGSGGFPLAGTLCGIEPRWASEVEPYPIAVTRERFPKVKHLGDISKINGAEIEPVDIITFGSPCQDLSVAGKRAGLKHEANGDEETTRSGLFMEAVRIIKEMRRATNGKYPRFALWENVPGAFSSNKGEDFRVVCEELIKVVEPRATMPEVPKNGWAYADSYIGDGWSLAYRTFDAQYWGVPQRRRRIHLIADFRGERAREVLFEREGVRGYFTQGGTPWQTTPTNAQGCPGADDREGEGFDGYNGDLTGDKSATLGVNCGISTGRNGVIERDRGLDAVVSAGFKPNQGSKAQGIGYEEEVSPTLLAGQEPGVVYAVATQQGGAEINQDGICPTITAAAGMSGNNQPWIVKPVGADLYNQTLTGDTAITLRCRGDNEHTPTVVMPYTMKERAGCAGGGKGPLVQEDKSATLATSNDQYLFQPVIAIDKESYSCGSGFNRKPGITVGGPCATLQTSGTPHAVCYVAERQPTQEQYLFENHSQDTRYKGPLDVAPIVSATYGMGGNNQPFVVEPKAPVYAVDQGGGKSSANVQENKAPTLCTTHGGEPAVAYQNKVGSLCARDYKGVGSQYVDEDKLVVEKDPGAVAYSINHQGGNVEQVIENKTGTLTAAMNSSGNNKLSVAYGTDVGWLNSCEDQSPTLLARQYKDPHLVTYGRAPRYIVRRLTPTECARLQGFADCWGHIEKKDSLTDEELSFWQRVRDTYALINGKEPKAYTEKQMLTWYNKLWTDSAEYKMWGNGIALPPALYCMQGIVDALNTEEEDDSWMM